MAIMAAAAIAGEITAGVAASVSLATAQLVYAAAYVMTYAAVSFATSKVVSALFGKSAGPRAGATDFAAQSQARTRVVRSAVEPMRVVYGEMLVSGPLVYANTTGTNKEFLHLVVALAAHEIHAIDSVYLNDEEIPVSSIDVAGAVTAGRFSGKARIKKHLGATTQTADTDLIADDPNWTTAHRLREIAYIYVRLEFDRSVYPTGVPNIKAVVRGKELYDPRTTTTYYSANPALIVRDYLTSALGLGAAAAEVDDTATNSAANTCDEFVTVTSVVDTFTADATTDTITRSNSDKYYQTGESVQLTTAGTLPAGLSLATDYFYVRAGNLTAQLATSYLNALAHTVINITDAGTGTHTITKTAQVRYDANGAVSLADAHAFIMEDVLTSAGGIAVYTQGVYKIRVAAATTANPDGLDETWLRGDVTVRPRVTRSDLFNAVRGTFVDPAKDWQPTDFPPQENATYEAQDGGEQLPRSIELPFTTNSTRAQRIAKIHLEKSRQGIVVEARCNLKALHTGVWDVVPITLAKFGWSAKEFRIIEWTLAEDSGIDLILQEESSASYDWANGNATLYDPAPDTDLFPGLTASPVTTLSLASGTVQLFVAGDGTVYSRILAAWTAPADTFVDKLEVQYKLSSASGWESRFVNKSEAEYYVVPVLDGSAYDVRIRAVNTLGISSTWATVSNHTVIGKTAPPENVTGFAAFQNVNVVTFLWDQVPDVDLAGYEIRYAPRGTLTWGSAVVATSVTRGTLVSNTAIPPGAWTVAIKAVDTSGNYSTTEAIYDLTASQANVVVKKVSHVNPWTGTTATSLVLHPPTGRLVPQSQNLASADGWETFDQFVVNPVALCYLEGAEMDVGFDSSGLRLWGTSTATLGPGETGVADPRLEMKYKPNAGAYSAFAEWTVGTVPTARYVTTRSKIDTSTGVPYLTAFDSTLDREQRTQSGSGVAISIGGTTTTYSNQFHAAPIVYAWAEGSTPRVVSVYNVTATSFDAKVSDTGGTDVGGKISYSALGA